MPAGIKNFTSLVQCASVFVVQYFLFLFQADSTFSGYWIDWRWSIDQSPINTKLFSFIFQLPDMVSKGWIVSVFAISQVWLVPVDPFLKSVPRNPCVCFCVPWQSVSHCGPVYHAISFALALNSAYCNATPAITARLLGIHLLVVLHGFHVMSGNRMWHVRHALVTEFDSLSVKQFMQGDWIGERQYLSASKILFRYLF